MRVIALLFHDVYREDPAESGFAGPAADRYKLALGDFEAQLAGIAAVRRDPPARLPLAPGPPALPPPWALTVDDGGVSFHTLVAGRLEARGWRAHCFVTTGCLGRPGFLDGARLRELRARGHVIGSHSVSHPARFSACPAETMLREWRDSRAALEDLLGAPVTAASVPGGAFSAAVARAAQRAGFATLFTSEAQARTRAVEGCVVVGRFTVRRGCPGDFAGRLVSNEARTLRREWAGWTAKKAAKACLGTLYPRVAAGWTAWRR